ncbi:reverse transcriptase domain-containing protein [Tanacetum coccineum]
MDSGSSCEVIYEHCFLKLKPSIQASKVDSQVPLVGFSGGKPRAIREVLLEITIGDTPLSRSKTLIFVIVRSNSPYNVLLGRTAMQKMGMVVSTIHEAVKFHTTQGIRTVFSTYESEKIEEGVKKIRETSPIKTKGVLSCTDVEEKIVVNSKYPEQTVTIGKQLQEHFKERLPSLLRTNADVFAWTHADMMGIPRTITIDEKPFNTEHKLNEYSHIKPIKQKRGILGPWKRISEKMTKNRAKTTKTEHEMEKREKTKSNRSQKVNQGKVKVKPGKCMRTCSSSNLVGNSSSNPTTSNPKRRNHRRSNQRVEPFALKESHVVTMADQRTMAELLRAPTEGYAEAIMVPPILAEHFEDSLNSAAGGNLLQRSTQDVLTIIENKSKQTSAVTTAMTAILKQFQATPPPAFVKAVEEICVTYGGPHPYYQCLAADDNTFLEYRDNIQGYVAATTGNYNQGNAGYRPPGVVNQTRPPGFVQQNGQNNQNRFSQPQGYNRGNNFNQNPTYQAPIQQNQSVPLSELEKIKKMNDVNMKAMQAQINNVKNQLRNEMQSSIQTSMSNQTNELKNMMASFFQMNTASTSGTGSLPSNTVANPKGELKAITTRSGLVLDGPTVPMPPPFINPEEDERVEETLTDPEHGEYTIKVPPPQV